MNDEPKNETNEEAATSDAVAEKPAGEGADEAPRGDSLQIEREDERSPGELTQLGPWRDLFHYEYSGPRLGQYVHLPAPVTIIGEGENVQFAPAGSVLFYDGEQYTAFEAAGWERMSKVIANVGHHASKGSASFPTLAVTAASLMEPSQASTENGRKERNTRAARQAADAAEALVAELRSRGAPA